MGTVYRESFTKPLPPDARVIVRKGKRLAEWKDAKGKTRTAPLTAAGDRITVQAGTYTAKYRDGAGVLCKLTTGCRDRTAAESVLAELEKRADKVRSGIRTAAEDAVIEHQAVPLAEHTAAYMVTLEAEGTSPAHRSNVERILKRLAADCQFKRLADLEREALERWLVSQEKAGMGGRTRNTYRAAAVAFANWCVQTGRLLVNPFAKVAKAAEDSEHRRQRRSLTEAELCRLLDVARRRPLEDRLTVYRGKRKGQQYAKLRPEVRSRLERLGRERALIYKTLVLTGLRKGELASLTVGQLELDADPPCLSLDAADEKNRQGSTLPLRSDLAADLRQWLAEKAAVAEEARRQAPSIKMGAEIRLSGSDWSELATRTLAGLPADTPLFTVPDKLVRILNRDLAAAGIPKRDERGRTVDVHALRHTFGTLLSKGGVAPRTAQAAMRHSTIDLTMNTYTDPKLLDVAGAVESLPALPLETGSQPAANAVSRTGTDDLQASPLVPLLVQATGKPCKSGSIPGKPAGKRDCRTDIFPLAVSALPVNDKSPLTTAVNGLCSVGDTGLEPVTPSLSSKGTHAVSEASKRLTATPPAACTAACTRDAENANAAALDAEQAGQHEGEGTDQGPAAKPDADQDDPLVELAAALLTLSPADRARLAAMLAGEQREGEGR